MPDTHKSFLYSQTSNQILKKRNGVYYSICEDEKVICKYGGGIEDLLIADKCNENWDSKSDIYNYHPPQGMKERSEEANSFLAGRPKFRIEEMEFFRVIFD